MIPYGKQDINQSDIDSVVSVLKSEFLTQGHQISFFEKNSYHLARNHHLSVETQEDHHFRSGRWFNQNLANQEVDTDAHSHQEYCVS